MGSKKSHINGLCKAAHFEMFKHNSEQEVEKILHRCSCQYDKDRNMLCVSYKQNYLLITERSFNLNDFKDIYHLACNNVENLTFGDADKICKSLFKIAAANGKSQENMQANQEIH